MSDDLVLLARRLYDAMERTFRTGDGGHLDGIVDPGYMDHGLGGGLPELKVAFLEFRESFSDVHIDVLDTVTQGAKVACRAKVTAAHVGTFWGLPATGRRVHQEGLDLLLFRGGRLVERWGHFDDVDMARQLGLSALPIP